MVSRLVIILAWCGVMGEDTSVGDMTRRRVGVAWGVPWRSRDVGSMAPASGCGSFYSGSEFRWQASPRQSRPTRSPSRDRRADLGVRAPTELGIQTRSSLLHAPCRSCRCRLSAHDANRFCNPSPRPIRAIHPTQAHTATKPKATRPAPHDRLASGDSGRVSAARPEARRPHTGSPGILLRRRPASGHANLYCLWRGNTGLRAYYTHAEGAGQELWRASDGSWAAARGGRARRGVRGVSPYTW